MTIKNIVVYKFSILYSAAILFLASCKKEQTPIVTAAPLPFTAEKYTMELTGAWILPDFTVPANAHFTNIVGMAHSKDTFIWKPDGLATLGVERVAEDGYSTTLRIELAAIVAANKALNVFFVAPPKITVSKTDTISLNTNNSYVSFVTMVAPTPDWFIGLSGFNCIVENEWVNEIIIPLYVYDAGTEDGDVFGYNNPITTPQQPIKKLTTTNGSVIANGNKNLLPIAFVKLKHIVTK